MGYDALGRVTSKFYYDTVNNPFTDAFNSKDTASWTWSSYQTVPYSDSGNNVVKSTGNGVDWGATFYRSSYNLTNGKGIQVRFKVDNANTSSHLSIESDDGTYRRFGITLNSGKISIQYAEGNN